MVETSTVQTYLAGLGASGAAMCAAAVTFLALIGIVTFDAWPEDANPFSSAKVVELSDAEQAADAAVLTLAPSTDAVTAAPIAVPLARGRTDGGGTGGTGGIGGTGGTGTGIVTGTGTSGDPGGTAGGLGGTGGGGAGQPSPGDTLNNTASPTINLVDSTLRDTSGVLSDTVDTVSTTLDETLSGLTRP